MKYQKPFSSEEDVGLRVSKLHVITELGEQFSVVLCFCMNCVSQEAVAGGIKTSGAAIYNFDKAFC